MVLFIAIGVVAFFVLAFALTILFKGRYMDSEIGTNPHMRARGIRCTAQQFRAEEAALQGAGADSAGDDCADCSSCALPCAEPGEKKKAHC